MVQHNHKNSLLKLYLKHYFYFQYDTIFRDPLSDTATDCFESRENDKPFDLSASPKESKYWV